MSRRIPSLTSFRALAAGLVLLCHVIRLDGLSGPACILKYGWAGVNLFFTLSGFLFTYLYLDSFTQGVQSLKEYLLKRIFRIYPLYAFLIAVTTLTTFKYGWDDILAHLTMTHAMFGRFRFSINPPAWTLSVEEAFYVMVPPLLMVLGLLPRKFGVSSAAGRLLMQIGVLLVVFWVFRFFCVQLIDWKQQYAGWVDTDLWTMTLFGRFSDFGFGVLAAILILRFPDSELFRTRWGASSLLFLGFMVFSAVSYWIESHGGVDRAGADPYFSHVVAMYGLSASLMILGLTGPSILQVVFDHPIAVYLGKISFALYLCQYLEVGPVYRVSLSLMEGCRAIFRWEWPAAVAAYIASNAVAALLYHAVESPCQKWLTRKFIGKTLE